MVVIEGVDYEIEYDFKDPYVVPGCAVGFCFELAISYLPVLFDPNRWGSTPFPPDFVAYRLIVDLKNQKLCILYEVYWPRQDCTWRELNKDHDHDYEQIQLHFNLATGEKEKVVISSVGPPSFAGHGVEIYHNVPQARVREVGYFTSRRLFFPWGSSGGQRNFTQIRDIPLENLFFDKKRPMAIIVNCYHAFAGVKRQLLPEEKVELNSKLVRLDRRLLRRWYYLNANNRFGHDVSKPFEEPHIMYYPPPEDLLSRFVYGLLWLFYAGARLLLGFFEKIKRFAKK